MKLNIKHKQTEADAIRHIKDAIDQHRAEIAKNAKISEERWEGNVLHFAADIQGQSVSGTLTVRDKEYEIEVTLPLMLRLFEGRIKKAIEEQAGRLL